MKRRIFYTTVLLLIFLGNVSSQQLNFQWGGHFRALGSTIQTGVFVFDSEIDAVGNIYCLGFVYGQADINPFAPVVTAVNVGSKADLAIIKLSSQGNFIWSKIIDSLDSGSDLHIDQNGDLILSGRFVGTVDFDPSSGTSILQASQNNGYILKLDSNGNFIWVKKIGGSGTASISGSVTDSFNNLYLSGSFNGSIDFDPGSGLYNRIASTTQSFLLKLDSNGNFSTMRSFQGNSGAFSVDVDQNQNVVLAGIFRGSVDLDWSSTTNVNRTSKGGDDIYILKIDSSLNYIWDVTMGGIPDDHVFKAKFDHNGNVITNGNFKDTIDLDPSSALLNYVSTGINEDQFFQKLDPQGNLIWAQVISAGTGKIVRDFKVDKYGNAYATGHFSGSMNFGQFAVSAPSRFDHFTCRINANGSFDWVDQIVSTSPYPFGGTSISIDLAENIYSFGNFIGSAGGSASIDINPSATANFNVTTGFLLYSSYVRKLNQCSQRRIDTITSCGPYTWIDGLTYSSSTDAPYLRISGGGTNGCDSVISLNLEITNGNVTTIDTVVNCNVFTWIDGNTYFSSNNSATYTYSNFRPNGCDSIVKLDLTILQSANSVDTLSVCGSYTWIDGVTYTQSNNTASFAYANAASNGCDSLVYLDLTVNSVSDTTVSLSGFTLTSNNNQASFQWLDCDSNFFALTGEVGQNFTATQNGRYAVELTENGCVDTSACILVSTVGFDRAYFVDSFSINPNPIQVFFRISSNSIYNLVYVYNSVGKLVETFSYKNANYIFNHPPGIYFIEIEDRKGNRLIKKMIKQ